MSDCIEVLFASDIKGGLQTVSCFNPHIGTTLMTYRSGGAVRKRCLSIIGNDYVLTADMVKPILHVWPLNSQEPTHTLQSVVAGKPSALCVSPDGCYCVAGIDGKIYVWQIASGILLNVISRHYQAINKILFMADSSHFVTAGEDGLVLVWKLSNVVAKQFGDVFKLTTSVVQPVFSFSHHSLPVTDAFIGHGNLKSRLFTVSTDQTCKIYSLSNGKLLLSIVFDYLLTSVVVNDLETLLFVGTNCGKILKFDLDPYPRSLEHHVSEETNKLLTFNGHTKAVVCLSVSFDGVTLGSGSDDERIFLWDIPSRQLIRTFEMKGPVSNMFFYFAPQNIFTQKFKPNLMFSKLEKTSNLENNNLDINILVEENLSPVTFNCNLEDVKEAVYCENKNDNVGDLALLKQEILRLKDANKQLYQFAMNKILKNPLNVGSEVRNGTE